MALFKWEGYKAPQVEMRPPKYDPDTKQMISPRIRIKFGPLPQTTMDGKRVKFDSKSSYLETDEDSVIKFIKQMPEYKRGIIKQITFKKEAVFVESAITEREESPSAFRKPDAKKKTNPTPKSVKDL